MQTAETSLIPPGPFDAIAPEVLPYLHRMTLDQYHRLGESGVISEKTELIRGILIDKMSESPLHSGVVELLADWLRGGLPKNLRVREGHPVTVKDSEPEPDICVVTRDPATHWTEHPKTAGLAVEVALSSEKLDRLKATLYAEAAIQEYWIVLVEHRCVERYRSPQDGKYTEVTTLKASDTLSPLVCPQHQIAVADLFPFAPA